jgi:hypothetical protein
MKKKERIEEIKNSIDYNDNKTYTWEIIPKEKSLFTSLIVVIAQSVLVPAIFFGVFYLIGIFLPSVAFWSALVFAFLMLFAWLALIFGKDFLQTSNIATYGGVSIGISLVGMIGFLIYSPESFFKSDFIGPTDNNMQWLLYVSELFLKVITLDIIEIFDLSFSEISPANNSGKFIVFAFNTVLSLGIVDGAIRTFGISRNIEVYLGTVRGLYEKLSSMVGEHGLKFRKIGVVQSLNNEREFVAMDFLDAYGKEFDKEFE